MTTQRPPRPPSDRDAPRGDRPSRGPGRAEGRDGPRSDKSFNNRGDEPRGDRAPRDAGPRGERFSGGRSDARSAPRPNRDDNRGPRGASERGERFGGGRSDARSAPRPNRDDNRGPRGAAERGERFSGGRSDDRSATRPSRDDNRGPRGAAERGERFSGGRSDDRSATRPSRDDNRGPRGAAERGERFGGGRSDARSAPRPNRDDNRSPRGAAERGERFGGGRSDARSAPRREFSRDERRGTDRTPDTSSIAGPWSDKFRSEGPAPDKGNGPRGERSASRTDRPSARTDRPAGDRGSDTRRPDTRSGAGTRSEGSRFDGPRSDSRRGEGRRSDAPRSERRPDTRPERPALSAKSAPRKAPARARVTSAADEVDSEGDLINGPQRIAKLLARAGVGSRRDVERMIEEGRIALNGEPLAHPAPLLASLDGLTVDGVAVEKPVSTRLYRFYKPVGCLTAARDPMGRKTIYDVLPEGLPRLMPVGRLDYNTEGLLLMTNDGEFKRKLELPASGVERTYRARAFGDISQAQLEELVLGVEIDGVRYGKIDANLERRTGRNQWIELTLTEGKNREVRNVLEHLGLQVSRLIRVRYGEFSIDGLETGDVDVVPRDLLFQFRRLLG